jgi:hypothetical protein
MSERATTPERWAEIGREFHRVAELPGLREAERPDLLARQLAECERELGGEPRQGKRAESS